MNVMISLSKEVLKELDKQAKDLNRTRSAHIKELVGRERYRVYDDVGCSSSGLRHVWSDVKSNCQCGERGPVDKQDLNLAKP